MKKETNQKINKANPWILSSLCIALAITVYLFSYSIGLAILLSLLFAMTWKQQITMDWLIANKVDEVNEKLLDAILKLEEQKHGRKKIK